MSDKPLLLLHNRHTPDDSDIWRAAIRNGWETCRVHPDDVVEAIKGRKYIRYYGNTINAAQIKDKLPISFIDINPEYLTTLEEFTKRRIILTRFGDLKFIKTPIFFAKPVHIKWFEAMVYKSGEVPTEGLDDDPVYISEPVNFIDEVRCFTLNGEVLTSSLYRINKISYAATDKTPEQINFDDKLDYTPIRQYVKKINELCDLPPGIVMDFGRFENGEWALIEFNEAWASGLYYCDPEKCLISIVNSQKDKI